MTVTSYQELRMPRGGKYTRKGQITKHREFLVVTDAPDTDREKAIIGAAGLPSIAEVHPDGDCWCVSIAPKNKPGDDSGCHWIVTYEYDNENAGRENVDPTLDQAKIVWTTEQFQKPFEKDQNDVVVLNAASDKFDPPPTIDDSRRAINLTKNFAVVPTWILSTQDTINDAPVTIDGITIATNGVKVQRVGVSDVKVRNEIEYRTVTMVLHATKDGWKKSLLNIGFRQIVGGKQVVIEDEKGMTPSVPTLLKADGTVLPLGDPETYLDFDAYEEIDFTTIATMWT